MEDVGVISGLGGVSLFKFYYAKYLDDYDKLEEASEILTYAIEKINQGYRLSTFCAGISGLGWVIDHLEQEEFLDIGADSVLANLDDYIHNSLKNFMKSKNYDFLHGGLGHGFYFLNRYINTNSAMLRSKYYEILLEFLALLEEMVEKDDENSYKWKSVLDIKTGMEGYNFSLSHGISAIISFLTKMNSFEEFEPKTRILHQKAINYLLGYYSEEHLKTRNAFFPSYVYSNNEPDITPNRIAWCYGDLGVALSLLNAGKHTNDKNILDLAEKTFRFAASIRSPEKSCVVDAGFCHGSFGNTHIFQKVYQETNDNLFKETAEFWLNEGLERGTHRDGFAGFKQYLGFDRQFTGSLSILEGVAGIGLVIIDQLSTFESKWDECLLIS